MRYKNILEIYKVNKNTLLNYVRTGKIRRILINNKEYDYNEKDLNDCFNKRFKRYNIYFYNNDDKNTIKQYFNEDNSKFYNINNKDDLLNYSMLVAKNKVINTYITDNCINIVKNYNYIKEYSNIFNITLYTIDINNDNIKIIDTTINNKENKEYNPEKGFNKMLNHYIDYGKENIDKEEIDEIEYDPK